MKGAFDRYIGIDYSGAETANSSLKGLRVYMADAVNGAHEVEPPAGKKRYWARRGIAEWLVDRLQEESRTLVGIDHAFSFPVQYFEKYSLPHNWTLFLDDFQRHWPTNDDHTYVCFIKDGSCGNGAGRCGDSRWRRLTELRARAKSVFHFDVPGSVAKSTHAGLPWLRHIRNRAGNKVHCWPFDGWDVAPSRSVMAEIYPALWSHSFPREGRNPDQQDAYAGAEWLRRCDRDGSLERFFNPQMDANERNIAKIEGWILGVA